MSRLLLQVPKLTVHEIYASIQGESSLVGLPCTFVRLSRCNLRCRWCDTPQAFVGGKDMQLSEVVAEIKKLKPTYVCITGGEPLLQESVHALIAELLDLEFRVSIETSGERDISMLDARVKKVMDLKAPGSGEVKKNRWTNIDHLGSFDEVKFVLAGREDFEWMKEVCEKYDLSSRVGEVLLSPVWNELSSDVLAEWLSELSFPVRMQVQLHKYIWGGERQGV